MTTSLTQEKKETAVADEPFQTVDVLTIAGGHFAHDTFSAFLSPLLPLIQDKLSTGYALTGSLAIFAQLPSLLNPLLATWPIKSACATSLFLPLPLQLPYSAAWD